MKTLKFRIVGESPLLMHNGQLADPLNEWAKALKKISGKRTKTDEDHLEMGRIEWFGSLYLKDGKPCLPSYYIEAALADAAKRFKLGKQAKAAIVCVDDVPLEYTGPKDPEKLWKDGNFSLVAMARVQNSRVRRTRPIFKEWSATIELLIDESQLNEAEVEQICSVAVYGEWRPKFGRATTTRVK